MTPRPSLTVKRVAKLTRRGVAGRYLDSGGNGVRGLYLCIGGKNNAHWELRYERNGRGTWMGLGSAKTFSLEEARDRAKKHRQRLEDGDDPLQIKRAERAAKAATAAATKTFKQCAEDYIARHRGKWRSAKHGQQWLTSLATYVYPKIGSLDVAAIGRPHILSVLEQRVEDQLGHPAGQFWQVRTTSADRLRNRVELILNFAAARGYRNGDNPARWDDLKHILPQPAKVAPVEHHAATPYSEVPTVIAELRKREGIAPRALEFLTLTATRTGEVLGATWDEIDLANKQWLIPAARMKGGREHRVPLSARAIELLSGLYREAGNPYLFIGARQPRLSDTALSELLKRLGRSETVHGFRSSFSDWAHEQTAHSEHTIEISLAHKVGDKVARAYQRGDMLAKRRQLMEQWGKYCTTPTTRVETSTNVMSMRRTADVS
jgi:integrase